jgi:quinolinate synthase
MFLSPDQSKIAQLVKTLMDRKIGIVAHFYMDPEVQGILTAAKRQWPHIHISDSLVMADSAVQMAEAGCKYIAVLGVDFMSENVRAILDQAGFNKVFFSYIIDFYYVLRSFVLLYMLSLWTQHITRG